MPRATPMTEKEMADNQMEQLRSAMERLREYEPQKAAGCDEIFAKILEECGSDDYLRWHSAASCMVGVLRYMEREFGYQCDVTPVPVDTSGQPELMN